MHCQLPNRRETILGSQGAAAHRRRDRLRQSSSGGLHQIFLQCSDNAIHTANVT